MLKFDFSGAVSPSKSILNRLMVVSSFLPDSDFLEQTLSKAEDIQLARLGLLAIKQPSSQEIFCGSSGAGLRFLALRASRERGRFRLTGRKKLMARPHGELEQLLAQLQIDFKRGEDYFEVNSSGWPIKGSFLRIELDRRESSQFASALLLSSWGFPGNIEIVWRDDNVVSQSYLQMTLDILDHLGRPIIVRPTGLLLPAHSEAEESAIAEIVDQQLRAFAGDADVSSAFVLASLAALAGRARVDNWPKFDFQPDAIFTKILCDMGADVSFGSAGRSEGQVGGLEVRAAKQLRAVNVDLKDCPDLFPVLSALCAFAEGTSALCGAPHLRHKESDRIQGIGQLLTKFAVKFEARDDGMTIQGRPELKKQLSQSTEIVNFDCQEDHRLAFAASLFMIAGAKMSLQGPEVVAKSFPEFWLVFKNSGGML